MGLAGGVPMAVAAALRRPAVERRARRRDRARVSRSAGGPEEAIAGLREAVVRLTGDPAYRASAQRIAAEMRALPPVDAAVGIVRGLLVDALAA